MCSGAHVSEDMRQFVSQAFKARLVSISCGLSKHASQTPPWVCNQKPLGAKRSRCHDIVKEVDRRHVVKRAHRQLDKRHGCLCARTESCHERLLCKVLIETIWEDKKEACHMFGMLKHTYIHMSRLFRIKRRCDKRDGPLSSPKR